MKSHRLLATFALLASFILPAYAENPLALIHQFSSTDSSNSFLMGPTCDLLLSGETLYGTVSTGGEYNAGMVFSVSTNGTGFRVIYEFGTIGTNDGYSPEVGLTLSSNGSTLYGTCASSGETGTAGTIFSVGVNGSGYSILHYFTGSLTDGAGPLGQMLRVGNMLYGTTLTGGAHGAGSVFSYNLNNSAYTVIYGDFDNQSTNGANPIGRLILDPSNGLLYGVTEFQYPGTYGGSVYSITTNGSAIKTIHLFLSAGVPATNATRPLAGLVLSGTTLYGTTSGGGTNLYGTVYSISTNGANYKTLHSFPAFSGDGVDPVSDLVVSGGVLYGTTVYNDVGSPNLDGPGIVFEVGANGTGYEKICNINSSWPSPYSGLVASSGSLVLYGTSSGFILDPGTSVNGAVFSVTP